LATVERAVRLISEGALDRAPVEVLAASLGVGPRDLSRLFDKHLGVYKRPPTEIRRAQRNG
jgi:AraC family transcriptional regulator of adaptative response / DNA-3-methyladenine glycosylase II